MGLTQIFPSISFIGTWPSVGLVPGMVMEGSIEIPKLFDQDGININRKYIYCLFVCLFFFWEERLTTKRKGGLVSAHGIDPIVDQVYMLTR